MQVNTGVEGFSLVCRKVIKQFETSYVVQMSTQ